MKREPDNNPTRLPTTILFLKLKVKFLNEGSQRGTEECFTVNSKQLSKLLTGRCYLGGKDRKGDGTKQKKLKRKSLRSSTAVKDSGDGDDDDDRQ